MELCFPLCFLPGASRSLPSWPHVLPHSPGRLRAKFLEHLHHFNSLMSILPYPQASWSFNIVKPRCFLILASQGLASSCPWPCPCLWPAHTSATHQLLHRWRLRLWEGSLCQEKFISCSWDCPWVIRTVRIFRQLCQVQAPEKIKATRVVWSGIARNGHVKLPVQWAFCKL